MTEQVGTEILESDMPSNIDFDSKQPAADSVPHSSPIQYDGLTIKSYSVKGKSIFSLPPQYPLDSIAPLDINTLPVRCLSQEELSAGLKGFWESLVGYASREMVIDQGFIYVFARQKEGLQCIALWRLVDVFKVFVDLEDF